MNIERLRERHAELTRNRDALAALFDFIRLEGMIAAYEEVIQSTDGCGNCEDDCKCK